LKVYTGRLFAVPGFSSTAGEPSGSQWRNRQAQLTVSLFILKLSSLIARNYSFQPVNGEEPLTIFAHFHLGGNEP